MMAFAVAGAMTAAFVAASGSAAAQTKANAGRSGRSGRMAPPETNRMNAVDRRFLMKTAEVNVAEVMVGKLALQKSRSEPVRHVAQMLVKEHSQANDELKQLAAQKGVNLPNRPSRRHQAMYNRLSRISGAQFDKMFMSGQIKDHLNTITLFQSEIRQGTNADTREYALKYLPNIQNHTVHIVRAAEQIGVRPIPREARGYIGRTGANANRRPATQKGAPGAHDDHSDHEGHTHPGEGTGGGNDTNGGQ